MKGQITTSFSIVLLVLLVIGVACVMIGLVMEQDPTIQATITDLSAQAALQQGEDRVATIHSQTSHPEVSAELNNCVINHQEYARYKDRWEKGKFYFLCKMQDGRYGVVPAVLNGGTVILKTAFVPKDGTLSQAISYVEQSATRYLRPLP